MKDPTVPSLSVVNEGIQINITIPQTQAQVEEQGYTYNQAGFTYNQAGVMYGGVYNANQDVVPMFTEDRIDMPSINISNDSLLFNIDIPSTNALLYDQGYTYNQAGFTYNQIGIAYGGVYNYNEDIVPIELSFIDIYSLKPTPPPIGNNISLGPGFFLYIPQ